jgi:hypothetical protein
MLSYKWTDPRGLDYSDGMNPLAKRGFNRNNNPFVFDTLQSPLFVALRQALGIEPRIWVCPDPLGQLVAGLSTIDFNVPAEPNLWLWGINASSNPGGSADPAGFLVQISDSFTGAELFSQPIPSSQLYSSNPAQGVVNFLSEPRAFVPPSYPIVRIINLSSNPQTCVVNLFTAIETDVAPIP